MADVATLYRTVPDQEECRVWSESAAVAESLSGATYLLKRLSGPFLPARFRPRHRGSASDGAVEGRWRDHYGRALERLERAGIAVTQDRSGGADRYVQLRRDWDPLRQRVPPLHARGPSGRGGLAALTRRRSPREVFLTGRRSCVQDVLISQRGQQEDRERDLLELRSDDERPLPSDRGWIASGASNGWA